MGTDPCGNVLAAVFPAHRVADEEAATLTRIRTRARLHPGVRSEELWRAVNQSTLRRREDKSSSGDASVGLSKIDVLVSPLE